MVLSLKNYHFRKSIPLEWTFAPITRKSVIAMDDKRSHDTPHFLTPKNIQRKGMRGTRFRAGGGEAPV